MIFLLDFWSIGLESFEVRYATNMSSKRGAEHGVFPYTGLEPLVQGTTPESQEPESETPMRVFSFRNSLQSNR